jgi:hypothetical protein
MAERVVSVGLRGNCCVQVGHLGFSPRRHLRDNPPYRVAVLVAKTAPNVRVGLPVLHVGESVMARDAEESVRAPEIGTGKMG